MYGKVCLIFAFLFLKEADSAKILCVFMIPSFSHQIVYQPIWKELSLRGHEVTVLTPNPLNDSTLINLTEIDLGFSYKILQELNMQTSMNKDISTTTAMKIGFQTMSEIVEAQLSHPNVRALTKDRTRTFDVLLVEFFQPTMYAFSGRFRCPLIGVTPFNTFITGHDAVGNPSHPVLNHDFMLPFVNELGFFDRIYSTYYSIWFRIYYNYYVLPKQDLMARKYFGEDIPYLGDIERKVSLLLPNVNPITNGIRPNVATVIPLGRMHITKNKPLSMDLQQELDNAKEGVIYFNLGTNVRSVNLPTELKETIMESLSELPYKVLWKWEDDYLPGQPKNVIIRKWFPQQDVLCHRNVKVFLTQGGLQSMEEAISNGVPLVGMPFFGDQPLNVMKMVQLGIAQAVDPEKLTKEQLKAALIEVAENPKYRYKIREIGDLTSDAPMTGLEKAVWWTEYVIRHKGTGNLRSPATAMHWHQYLLLDVLGFVFAIILIVVYVLYRIVLLGIKFADW